jgi:hypothetical protein
MLPERHDAMTTDANGTSGSPDQVDLDRLIGELETEAARRRAEPGYPHDADARLHFELARRAPDPSRSSALKEMVARVGEVASADTSAPHRDSPDARGSRRRHREVLRRRLEELDGRVTASGMATAAALHAVVDRLEQLEERVRHLDPRGDEAAPPSSPPQDSAALGRWRSRLPETLATGDRVLYAQAEAEGVVAELRAAGIDAYGITGTESGHRPGPDVRSGDLLTHLRAVPDDALGAVVLAGPPETMSPQGVGPLVAELGRVAGVVVIISEAPWWWRSRLGAVRADLAEGRPLDPDTWLHAFHGVAMAGTAEYDPTGQSYRVVVRAQE